VEAQTLADLIADWRQHIGQTDSSNSNFSDAQGTIWANQGYGIIVAKIRHIPRTERDYDLSAYAAASGVTLNAQTLRVDTVLLKNPDVNNPDGTAGAYDELEIIEFDDLIKLDPNYQAVTANFPQYAVRKSTGTMILYPTPKATVKAQTTPLRTYGLESPASLAANTDVPDIPVNLHYLIPHWMAYRSFAELENQAKVTEHLTLWNSGLKDNRGLATEFSKKLNQFRWEERID
jgi:hypothetical protein